jgi:hypothetical protein
MLHGYLDLMLASIYVYNNNMDLKDKIVHLLESARSTFKFFVRGDIDKIQEEIVGHVEGLAETYFVEAILNMQVFKN